MKEQPNYKDINQRNSTTSTQHEETDKEEKELIEKYGQMSAPAITHILRNNEDKQKLLKEKYLQTRDIATLLNF